MIEQPPSTPTFRSTPLVFRSEHEGIVAELEAEIARLRAELEKKSRRVIGMEGHVTLVDRLVAGEELTGADALQNMIEQEQDPWRFAVRIAIACLKVGKVNWTRGILEKLLENEEGR